MDLLWLLPLLLLSFMMVLSLINIAIPDSLPRSPNRKIENIVEFYDGTFFN
jgi:hypothetical protein